MKSTELFAAALGLHSPWLLSDVRFEGEGSSTTERSLHLYIEHKKGARFALEGTEYPVYDHQERTWRHLNFFEHTCYLHASVPRVQTEDGRTVLVDVPWAKAGSSFTLLFEAFSMLLVAEGMSLSAAGRFVGLDGRIIGRVIQREVEQALEEQDLEQVEQLGLDETSSRKGHSYLTVLTDRDRKKVVGLSVGKDGDAVANALSVMELRGSKASGVRVVTLDMSAAYIAGCRKLVPQADLVFDRFHLEALLNKCVDQVRREDQKQTTQLRNSRYLWLRNHKNLNKTNQERVHYLSRAFPRIGKAHQLKEQFKEVWSANNFSEGIKSLEAWLSIAKESGLKPILQFAETVKNHWAGIREYFRHWATNAFAERVNLKIQEIKRTARGYANIRNYMVMIYFHLGGLNLGLPTKNS